MEVREEIRWKRGTTEKRVIACIILNNFASVQTQSNVIRAKKTFTQVYIHVHTMHTIYTIT